LPEFQSVHYSLVTQWHLAASIDLVWEALTAIEKWPCWWRYVKDVVAIEKGGVDGLNSVYRYTWTSKLPYRLCFNVRTSGLEKPQWIEGIADGDLKGVGRWELRDFGDNTWVTYHWTVATEKVWMNALSPLLSPVFAWNHDQVMQEGGRGIARYLGVALLDFRGSGSNTLK
jgi:uncharacterized protein YndB with AHSA1/START domain